MASARDLTRKIEKPAMSSLASVKGPSMTVRDLPENLTRAPLELGWRPSRASRTPAFMSSSLYLPISAMSCGSGRAPAFSVSGVALAMTMNRIAKSPLGCAMAGCLFSGLASCWLTGELRLRAQLGRCCSLSYWLSADTSNTVWPNRHEDGISLIIFREDERWSKLPILFTQVEHSLHL